MTFLTDQLQETACLYTYNHPNFLSPSSPSSTCSLLLSSWAPLPSQRSSRSFPSLSLEHGPNPTTRPNVSQVSSGCVHESRWCNRLAAERFSLCLSQNRNSLGEDPCTIGAKLDAACRGPGGSCLVMRPFRLVLTAVVRRRQCRTPIHHSIPTSIISPRGRTTPMRWLVTAIL